MTKAARGASSGAGGHGPMRARPNPPTTSHGTAGVRASPMAAPGGSRGGSGNQRHQPHHQQHAPSAPRAAAPRPAVRPAPRVQSGSSGVPRGAAGGATTLRRDPSSGRFFRTTGEGDGGGASNGSSSGPPTRQLENMQHAQPASLLGGGAGGPIGSMGTSRAASAFPYYPGSLGTHCGL
jgi:hypothetical protein